MYQTSGCYRWRALRIAESAHEWASASTNSTSYRNHFLTWIFIKLAAAIDDVLFVSLDQLTIGRLPLRTNEIINTLSVHICINIATAVRIARSAHVRRKRREREKVSVCVREREREKTERGVGGTERESEREREEKERDGERERARERETARKRERGGGGKSITNGRLPPMCLSSIYVSPMCVSPMCVSSMCVSSIYVSPMCVSPTRLTNAMPTFL